MSNPISLPPNYQQTDILQVVNDLDPAREPEEIEVYVFGGRRVFIETQPYAES